MKCEEIHCYISENSSKDGLMRVFITYLYNYNKKQKSPKFEKKYVNMIFAINTLLKGGVFFLAKYLNCGIIKKDI